MILFVNVVGHFIISTINKVSEEFY